MLISATGRMTGSARQDFNTMPGGRYCDDMGVGSVKVAVTGQSPAIGNQFILRLLGGSVDQRLGTAVPNEELLGSFVGTFCSCYHAATGNSTGVKPLSELSVGQLFQESGNLYMKVAPKDENGNSIAPAAGNSWVWQCNGSVVSELVDTTSVEVCNGSPSDWKLA